MVGTIISWLMANWKDIAEALLAILGGFSIIAKLTPTKADDKIVDAILRVVHGLGLTKK